MAKKLNEIEKLVESKSADFYKYLQNSIPYSLMNIISSISQETNVYLFSGLIRNYFLGVYDYRDIDLVLESAVDVKNYFKNYNIQINSYGGYKIAFDDIPVDIWFAKDSWAYKVQKVFDFDLAKFIFQTAYFNFSAIIFSLNEKKFYYSKHFLRFLQNKKIDVVFPINKNYDLCLINAIYYSEKYNLKISDYLTNKMVKYYQNQSNDFDSIQKEHFGYIKYDFKYIDDFIKKITT